MNLIDVTIRESVYLRRGMTEEKSLKYLERYVECMPFDEVQDIEICFLDNDTKGTLLYDEDYINAAYEITKGKYGLVAVIHPAKVNLEQWNPEVIQKFHTVRFMLNNEPDPHAEDIIDYLHACGVEVSLNIIYVSRKNEEFISKWVDVAHKHDVEWFTFADSSGNCLPCDVKEDLEYVRSIDDTMKFNYHLHDHFGTAMANALTCYPMVDIMDCSAHGIGKGGGNLSMENLVFACRKMEKREISADLVCAYAQLLKYLVADILEEDWDIVAEEYENLLIGVFNRNLKEIAEAEEKAKGDYFKLCRLLCGEN